MMAKAVQSLWFRLILGFTVPKILFLGAAMVSYISVQRLMVALDEKQQSQEILTGIKDIQENVEGMAASNLGYHFTGKQEYREGFEKNRKLIIAELAVLREKTKEDPRRAALIERIANLNQEFFKNTKLTYDIWNKKFSNEGQFKEFFQEMFEKILHDQGMNLIQEMRVSAKALQRLEKEELSQNQDEVIRQTRSSQWAIVVALIVSIGFSIIISSLLSWSITRPIGHLSKAINSFRQGKFEAIRSYGPTEISNVIRGFNLMGLALTEKNMLLENRELRYRTVVGTTSNLMWTTTADGTNSEMASWGSFTGQSIEATNGDGWLDAIHPEDRHRFVRRWMEAVTEKSFDESEFRIRRADGCYRDFNCRSVPIFDANDEIVEWVRICVDITEKRQEEKLRHDKEVAETANRAKSEFLAKMSHELRTPLNAIIGMSKMLMTQRFGVLNEKQLDYLSDITQAGQHLLELINDILDFSKVEAGRIDLNHEPIPAVKTIESVLSTIQPLATKKNIALESHLPDIDNLLTVDVRRFKQVLYNLLSNAVKFTPTNGHISVRCNWVAEADRAAPIAPTHDAHAIRIDVEDSGIGISREDQEKLGSEFFQVSSSPTKAQEGTGLGLALSRRLVDIMGGSFWFTSELGEGSTFSFALPLKPEYEANFATILSEKTQEVVDALTLDHTGRPLALIIDDHIPTNKLLVDWLDEAGLDSTSAYDGESGLEAALRLKPQLILLDIRLPGVNGLQVLNQIKSNPDTAHIPVVIVTVLEGVKHIHELDILDWFVKPLEKEQVIMRLQKAVPSLFVANRKVLIVDDNEADRNWFHELLENMGMDLREAANANDAIQMIRDDLPDLILVDLVMPEIDGFQLVQQIRNEADWQKIPIIIVTAKDLSDEERDRLQGNIQAIIRKDSLEGAELILRLKQILA